MKTPCVLLPIYNSSASLDRSITEILETLGELTGAFELCILDDGSTDDTADTARELAARYPQIRLIRHPVRLGLAESIQTALDNTEGEIVLIGDEEYRLDPDDLRTLWKLREHERQYVASDWQWRDSVEQKLARLLTWRPAHRKGPRARGFQIIHREAFEQFRFDQAAQMFRIDSGADFADGPAFLGTPRRFVWQD